MGARVSGWQAGDRAAIRVGLVDRVWPLLQSAWQHAWSAIQVRRATQKRRTLRVLETVGMGEKRFVAIVQVQEVRYLVGGGAAGISLLARLDAEQEFAAVLEEQGSAADALGKVVL